MKARIIKRTELNGDIRYVIQQKHWIFRWLWVDGWENSCCTGCKDNFSTLDEAKFHLRYFDGSEVKEEVCKI